jgi:hypothetical protein
MGAYTSPLRSPDERTRALRPGLHNHDTAHPCSHLKGKPRLSRIDSDNVLGNDS